MIEHLMTVLYNPRRLVFTPEADFTDIELVVPEIRSFDQQMSFRQRVGEVVAASCCHGEKCDSYTRIDAAFGIGPILIKGAVIRCTKDTCPLREPPASNDNEPLIPTPTPPELEAYADQSVETTP